MVITILQQKYLSETLYLSGETCHFRAWLVVSPATGAMRWPYHFKPWRKSLHILHIVDWPRGWLQKLMLACTSSEWERRSRWQQSHAAGWEEAFYLGSAASSKRLANRPFYSLFGFLSLPP
jgi:hypothetical protein